jgi:hypothetical protein
MFEAVGVFNVGVLFRRAPEEETMGGSFHLNS